MPSGSKNARNEIPSGTSSRIGPCSTPRSSRRRTASSRSAQRGDAEAEVVEPDPVGIEAVGGSDALVVDGSQSDEHPLVGEDHPTLERIHERVVVLVVGRRRFRQRDVEAEDLGVEGHRPPDVGDRETQMMDGTHGKVRHGAS